MKVLSRILAVSTLAVTLTGGVILAQDRPNDQHAQQHQKYMRHNEWKKGAHIKTEDWGRGEQIDWHAHHLRQPPKGYEWREVDGNYVCANSGGVIFSVVIAH